MLLLVSSSILGQKIGIPAMQKFTMWEGFSTHNFPDLQCLLGTCMDILGQCLAAVADWGWYSEVPMAVLGLSSMEALRKARLNVYHGLCVM